MIGSCFLTIISPADPRSCHLLPFQVQLVFHYHARCIEVQAASTLGREERGDRSSHWRVSSEFTLQNLHEMCQMLTSVSTKSA
ncbi:hypothetical protein R1flu_027027 [Riccia fluitans]|uniref:Uncharacterized protein n=1 Tax=Riccia fluitans TaxID=41844 RepID=A0ABD1XHL2_9MARC